MRSLGGEVTCGEGRTPGCLEALGVGDAADLDDPLIARLNSDGYRLHPTDRNEASSRPARRRGMGRREHLPSMDSKSVGPGFWIGRATVLSRNLVPRGTASVCSEQGGHMLASPSVRFWGLRLRTRARVHESPADEEQSDQRRRTGTHRLHDRHQDVHRQPMGRATYSLDFPIADLQILQALRMCDPAATPLLHPLSTESVRQVARSCHNRPTGGSWPWRQLPSEESWWSMRARNT